MRLTHLGLSLPVSVHFVFVHARSSLSMGVVSVLIRGHLSWFTGSHLRSWAGFMFWAFVIHVWGSLWSVLSFVGAALLCMGGGARS